MIIRRVLFLYGGRRSAGAAARGRAGKRAVGWREDRGEGSDEGVRQGCTDSEQSQR